MEPMTAMMSTKASVLSLALTLMLTLTMAAEILLTLTLMGDMFVGTAWVWGYPVPCARK